MSGKNSREGVASANQEPEKEYPKQTANLEGTQGK
jgi:hypothetical protein